MRNEVREVWIQIARAKGIKKEGEWRLKLPFESWEPSLTWFLDVRCFRDPTGHIDCLGKCRNFNCGYSRTCACAGEVGHREDAALLQGSWHPHSSAQPLHALHHLPQQHPRSRGNASMRRQGQVGFSLGLEYFPALSHVVKHTYGKYNTCGGFFFFWLFPYIFFVCFNGCIHGIWKFLGQELNPSHSCNLCHSCGNARSLTPCAGPGI